jgi:peptidoglycan/LPS O-acetylase OafA/YrhL
MGDQNPNLDLLRSLAVLAVFATHQLESMAGCRPGGCSAFGVNTHFLGQAGVLIFFVHTSLVLMQSLERTRTNLCGWELIRHFYIRRAFRIYPLSICLIVLSITLSIPPNALGAPYRWEGLNWALSNLLLVQNVTHSGDVSNPLWSLPYEVQMYLMLPVLFLSLGAAGRREAERTKGSGLSRLAMIYAAGLALSVAHPLFRYLPCFLAGVAAYQLSGAVPARLPGWLWCPTITGAIALYAMTPYDVRLKAFPLCLLIGVTIPRFQANSGAIAAAAAQIAKYSYGIYLCHTPILWLLYRKLTVPGWQRPILAAIGTVAVSLACYHAIERPLIRIGGRLASRLSQETGDRNRPDSGRRIVEIAGPTRSCTGSATMV